MVSFTPLQTATIGVFPVFPWMIPFNPSLLSFFLSLITCLTERFNNRAASLFFNLQSNKSLMMEYLFTSFWLKAITSSFIYPSWLFSYYLNQEEYLKSYGGDIITLQLQRFKKCLTILFKNDNHFQ